MRSEWMFGPGRSGTRWGWPFRPAAHFFAADPGLPRWRPGHSGAGERRPEDFMDSLLGRAVALSALGVARAAARRAGKSVP